MMCNIHSVILLLLGFAWNFYDIAEVIDITTSVIAKTGQEGLLKYQDPSGRPERQWLPGLSTGGGYVKAADIDYSPYGEDAAPYSLTEYEPSTLDRIKRRYGPGEEWHSSGNAVAHSYGTSTSTTGDLGCFRYVTASSGGGVAVRCTGRYGAGELLVERVTDEDGREGLTFTDGLGRKVLERRPMGDGTYADTYFVYDDRDNLAVVMPPEASARMAHTGMWQAASEELDLHCYIYSYDGFHRMTGMKLPGCGMRETVYDSADRPLLWRDGNLRAKGRWGFRITDMLGREVLTGTCASWSGPVASLPVYASPERFPDPLDAASVPRAPSTLNLHGYDLYDYEARLYDPATLRFLRPDDHASTHHRLSPFSFCANNPLVNTDPTGKYVESPWDIASLAMGVTSLVVNVQQGNVGDAIVDGVGILLDAAAVALPGVPGGVSTGIKAYRTLGKSVKMTDRTIKNTTTLKIVNSISEREIFKISVEDTSNKSYEEVYDISIKDTDKHDSVQFAAEHEKNARGSTYDKYTAHRAGKTYGESRNNQRGDKNRKYQKSPNPNKRKNDK